MRKDAIRRLFCIGEVFGDSNPERATSVKKRLIIVFSEVGAQTGTARLRAVVKQARCEADVSLKARQKKRHFSNAKNVFFLVPVVGNSRYASCLLADRT